MAMSGPNAGPNLPTVSKVEDSFGRGRIDECREVTESEMAGTRGKDGTTVELPMVGYENPGATVNLRGVEANTGKKTEAGNSYDLPKQDGSLSGQDEVFMGTDPHGDV